MMSPELLAPAGSLEKLKVAVRYGADAVYLGAKEYSLRAKAENFSTDELMEAVHHCEREGVRAYVTLNIFPKNRDLAGIERFLRLLSGDVRPHGIIVSDPGVLALCRKTWPEIPIHISTQANVTNVEAARFWQGLGAVRINLARELSFREIREIKRALSCQVEVFVHGALCISWSGRCLLSLYMTGRDANQGACAHPCRYSYRLEEEKRPGEFFHVEEDQRGTYIFSSRDLCLIRRLYDLSAAGIDALKIEGRTKGIFYLAHVVRAYRAALDSAIAALGRPDVKRDALSLGWQPPEGVYRELSYISSRKYTENFFEGIPRPGDMAWEGTQVDQSYAPAALVLKGGNRPIFRALHVIRPGDSMEYMDDRLDIWKFRAGRILATDGTLLPKTIGGEELYMELHPEEGAEDGAWEGQVRAMRPYSVIRKRVQPGSCSSNH
jgi:putative protease